MRNSLARWPSMVPSRFLIPLVLVLSACLPDRNGESSFDPTRLEDEDLDHYVERVLAEQGVSGMSLAVIRAGELLLAKGGALHNPHPHQLQ